GVARMEPGETGGEGPSGVLVLVEGGRVMVRVGVAGATGYMGAELLRLLAVHPKVQVTTVMASERSAGTPVGRLIPSLRGHLDLTVEALDAERLAAQAECALLALPHGQTHHVDSPPRRHARRAPGPVPRY